MDDAPDAVNITSQFVTVGANTKLNFFNMTTGAAVSRLQGFITLAGEGSELSINGVNLLKKIEHGDKAAPAAAKKKKPTNIVDLVSVLQQSIQKTKTTPKSPSSTGKVRPARRKKIRNKIRRRSWSNAGVSL